MGTSDRVVVFDAMGVLYEDGDDVAAQLIPYLRDRGCSLTDTEITDLYRQASLGYMSSDALWSAYGVSSDDARYCLGHRLTPGIDQLLADLHDHGVRMACLSNDVSEWSILLRDRFALSRWIDTWVISGDIGLRKPDPEAFRTLSARLGVPLELLVFFDDMPRNVEAAQALGIDAVKFTGAEACREALLIRGLVAEPSYSPHTYEERQSTR